MTIVFTLASVFCESYKHWRIQDSRGHAPFKFIFDELALDKSRDSNLKFSLRSFTVNLGRGAGVISLLKSKSEKFSKKTFSILGGMGSGEVRKNIV